MSTCRIERIGNSNFEILNVIHQLPLIHARAADQLFECDVIEDGADGAIHFCPDRSEVAGCRFAAIIAKVAGLQAGELNEGPAHTPDHFADGDLARMPGIDVTPFCTVVGPDNLAPYQAL